MGTTPISRSDLGAGVDRLLERRVFQNLILEHVDGKEAVYRACDFSYSIIIRSYFHKARFEKCKFVGTRFIATNFRSATFEDCDFSYADFDRCVVPIPQVLANLPTYSNVRRELLHNLRANGRAICETQHESDLVWREIDAEIEHWRLISRGHSGYYKKYSFKDRALARIKHWHLLAERYVWGHGESLWRLSFATAVGIVALGLFNAIGAIEELDASSINEILRHWLESSGYIAALFVDLPVIDKAQVIDSPITSTLAVVLRYASIGLAVPVLYKYITKR